jgi:integral membrane protein
VDRLFSSYRVLAYVVGVLLAFGTFVAIPLKYLTTEGTGLNDLGNTLSLVWVVHGWIYLVYVVVAFLLARRERWSVTFTLLMLAAGLIPLLIFWVERWVEQKVLADAATPGDGASLR